MVPTVQRCAADVFFDEGDSEIQRLCITLLTKAQRRSGEPHGGAGRWPRAAGGVPDPQFYPDDYVVPA